MYCAFGSPHLRCEATAVRHGPVHQTLSIHVRISISSDCSPLNYLFRLPACPLCPLISLIRFETNMTLNTASQVTRIACFRFKPHISPEEKGGRTRAFLDLYAQHPELIVAPPKGGRPLNTPLDLTNVKRDKEWDTGFVVVFKVCSSLLYVMRGA